MSIFGDILSVAAWVIPPVGMAVHAASESDKQTKEAIKNTQDAAYMGAVTKQINAFSAWANSLPTGR